MDRLQAGTTPNLIKQMASILRRQACCTRCRPTARTGVFGTHFAAENAFSVRNQSLHHHRHRRETEEKPAPQSAVSVKRLSLLRSSTSSQHETSTQHCDVLNSLSKSGYQVIQVEMYESHIRRGSHYTQPPITSSSALLSQRGCAMLPVSLVSFNSTILRAQSFIIIISALDYTTACNEIMFCYIRRNVETSCHKHFVVRLPRTTNDAAYCY